MQGPKMELVKLQKKAYIFVFRSFFTLIRSLVFSFELFYIVLSGPFIADYAVWALFIVEGRTVTYSC